MKNTALVKKSYDCSFGIGLFFLFEWEAENED